MSVINGDALHEIENIRENDVCTFCGKKIKPPCVYYHRGRAAVLICMDCCEAWQGLAADMIQVAATAQLRRIGRPDLFFERSDGRELRETVKNITLFRKLDQ